MISVQDKLLRSYLGSLPSSSAEQFAQAIELGQLSESSALPLNVLETVRQTVLTDRKPSPLRLFCQPFEDLLATGAVTEKRKGRIARENMLTIWGWLSEYLLPAQTAAFVGDARTAIAADDLQAAYRLAHAYWPIAAQVLENLAGESPRADLRAKLAGKSVAPSIYEDALEIALMLRAGQGLVDVQTKLPRGAATLSDDVLWQLRATYEQLLATVPDAAPYVAVITMARLAKPWEALRLPLLITRKNEDTLLAATDMGLVGEILLHTISDHADAIYKIHQPDFDVDEVLRHLSRFTELSHAVTKEIDIRRDGRWGQSLMKDRSKVSDGMEALLKRATKEMLAALPMQKSGAYGAGPRDADVSHQPDMARISRAMRYARLLAGSKDFASRAGFTAHQGAAQEEVERELRLYIEKIVDQVNHATGPHLGHAQAYAECTADLAAILFSLEEGDHLRRRVRAAVAA